MRELIAALELMNVIDFPNRSGNHPISAYEKWSTPLKKYGDDFVKSREDAHPRKYGKLEPLLPDILALYDIIRRDFLRVYSEEVSSHAAKLKIVEEAGSKAGVFKFRFANLDPNQRRLTKGAAYPILAAFRNYVRINPETQNAEWVGGFDHVKDVWRATAKDLVLETREAIKSIGNAPDALGKNRNHWSNLYRAVENYFLREQIERLQAGGL